MTETSKTPETDREEYTVTERDIGFQVINAAKCRELELRLSDREAEVARLEKLVYVPGAWRCAKCKCGLISNTLYVATGAMAANNKPQECPNGCGPMWRLTERDAGNEVCDRLEALAIKQRASEEYADGLREAAQWLMIVYGAPHLDIDQAERAMEGLRAALAKNPAYGGLVADASSGTRESAQLKPDRQPSTNSDEALTVLDRAIAYCQGQSQYAPLTSEDDAYDRGVAACVRVLEDMKPYPVSPTKGTTMNFGDAIEEVKAGRCVQRAGWNGKGMFIFLNKGSFDHELLGFKKGDTPEPDHPSTMDGISLGLFETGAVGTLTRLPNINMRSASGSTVTGWLASQTDLLAEDWQVIAP